MTTTSVEQRRARIFELWQRLAPLPGGRILFNRILGWKVPYTGTIRPEVVELEPGHARIRMRDRRRIRNHLDSIHALALANVAELTTGLALLAALPADARTILTGLEVEFVKKARGDLVAECMTEVDGSTERREHTCQSVVRDRAGDVVVRATTRWLIGSTQKR